MFSLLYGGWWMLFEKPVVFIPCRGTHGLHYFSYVKGKLLLFMFLNFVCTRLCALVPIFPLSYLRKNVSLLTTDTDTLRIHSVDNALPMTMSM